MNAIPANKLKPHGNNDEYAKLAKAAQVNMLDYSHTVMEWFALQSCGVSSKEEIDQRLNAERELWYK